MANTAWLLPLLFLAILFRCVTLAQPTVQNSVWKAEKSVGFEDTVRLGTPRAPPLPIQFQQSMDLLLLELEKRRVETESLRADLIELKHSSAETRAQLNKLWDGVDLLVKKLVKNSDCACAEGSGKRERRRKGSGKGRRRGRKRGERKRNKGERVSKDDHPAATDLAAAEGADTSAKSSSRSSKELAYGDENGAEFHNVTHVKSDIPGSSRGHGALPEYLNPRFYPSRGDEEGALIEDADDYSPERTSTSPRMGDLSTATPDPISYMYNGSIPRDCEDIRRLGYAANGTYIVMTAMAKESFPVVCEFHASETWTVIQRRQDGSEDFYRTWLEYKRGFGSLAGEFWLGNEFIHQLTNQNYYRLRIDMWDWPKPGSDVSGKPHVPRYFFAESRYFLVSNETRRYELHVPNDYFAYTGFGGSGLRIHAGPFLTKDVKSLPEGMRQNCAQKFHCGWWFSTCVRNANFNGRYYKGGYADTSKKQRARDDVYWPNIDQSLQKVAMKIGRVNETYALGGLL